LGLSDGTAGGYGARGEAEHVGTQGVLSAPASLGRREHAIGVNLALEAAEEGLAADLVRALRSAVRLHEMCAAICLLMSFLSE
jgi:hypothetical protein